MKTCAFRRTFLTVGGSAVGSEGFLRLGAPVNPAAELMFLIAARFVIHLLAPQIPAEA
jgi:hypothetical protein